MNTRLLNRITRYTLILLAAAGFATTVGADTIAYLGVNTRPVDPVVAHQLGLAKGMGLVVGYIDEDSAAHKVLQPHDILQKLDDQLLVNRAQLAALVRSHKPGDTVHLTVLRQGKPVELQTALGEREEAPGASVRPPLPQWPHANPMPFGVDLDQWPHANVQVFGPEAFSMGHPDEFMPEAMDQVRELLEKHTTKAGPGMSNELDRIMDQIRLSIEDGGHDATVHMNTVVDASAVVTLIDGDVTITLTTDGGDSKHLTAKDADGTVLFDGPVSTEEERAELPPKVAELYEQIDVAASKIDVRISSDEEEVEKLRILAPARRADSI